MSGLFAIDGVKPRIAPDVFLAPGCSVIGDVAIGARSSVWFHCVLRGDAAPIQIGCGSNIQDGCVIHADPGFPAVIGDDVLIGHMAWRMAAPSTIAASWAWGRSCSTGLWSKVAGCWRRARC